MEWRDEGIILGQRGHGETNTVLEVLTRHHGRHAGLVRGGRSRRMQAALQPGNGVTLVWRARLEDHLGNFSVEPTHQRAAGLMASSQGLHGLNSMVALLLKLAEREPHPRLYEMMGLTLDNLEAPLLAGVLMLRFELAFLDELGFGLDLGQCAATGSVDELIYVSPKSARAVSAAAGAPYHDQLLSLPLFLRDDGLVETANIDDVKAGARLTGYFLERHVLRPRGHDMPPDRARFFARICAEPPA
ncbi:MAG: DNA repair protein RecO [Pseudomonadota bacterium]